MARYKAIVREQWARLTIDQEAALEALPRLLPADADARRKLFEEIRAIRTAAGELDGEAKRRLDEMEALFNIAADAPAPDKRHVEVEGIMSDAIIVLNAGSSSLKFSIYGVADHDTGPRRHAGRLKVWARPRDSKRKISADRCWRKSRSTGSAQGFGHPEAFAHLAQWALEQYGGRLRAIAVGHRMAHGGLEFTKPTLIDAEVVTRLEQLVPLVPLHQPHNLAAVKGVMQLRPDLAQVACFDTAFHRTKPKVADRFGLPDEMFQRGARRWGFHGLSYESIAGQFRQIAPDISAGRVIVAHLGSGASLCAMKDGQSVDTTMGFSALDGLPMGTRCGNLDPARSSSCSGKAGALIGSRTSSTKNPACWGSPSVSNDVRVLLASDRPLAAEAIEFFVYRIVREIGSLTAALGGLDALVFTAGIGENSPVIRQQVCQGLAWLGITIDPDANQHGSTCISPKGKAPSVWVIPTDEEAVIASHTLAVVRSARTLHASRVPADRPVASSAGDDPCEGSGRKEGNSR